MLDIVRMIKAKEDLQKEILELEVALMTKKLALYSKNLEKVEADIADEDLSLEREFSNKYNID